MATPDAIAEQLVRDARTALAKSRFSLGFYRKVEEIVGSKKLHQPIALDVARSLRRLGHDTGNSRMKPVLADLQSDETLSRLLELITFCLCAHISDDFDL